MLILNSTDFPYHFPFLHADGTPDKLYCGPKSKSYAPEGATPDPEQTNYPQGIKLVMPGQP